MKSPDGKTLPIWCKGVEVPTFPALTADENADVCVVGAGIAGLTTAYLLAKAHRSVVVIDAGPVGDGQTARTSAHLASALDDRFTFIEKSFGKDGAKLAYESHSAAIDKIEQIAADESIDCEFARVDGYLFLAPDQEEKQLDEELAAAHRAGFTTAEKLSTTPSFDSGVCIRFPNQGQFHPMKYLAGLARACEKLGVKIFTGSRVIDVQGTDEKNKKPAVVTTLDEKHVHAKAIVVATNTPSPINDWFGIYTKQAAYRTYMVGLRVPKNSVTAALYWDMADPYHYVRVEAGDDDDVLLVGGEDHRTGQHPDGGAPFMRLEQWTRKRFPQATHLAYHWSGQVQEPADGLGYIGRAPTANPNVYVITGDSGMGLTHATIGGLLITDSISGNGNPWQAIYDPSRKPIHSTSAIKEYVVDNAETVKKYADYITPGEFKGEDEIRPGMGGVLRQGLGKVAVYRDPSGGVHKHSAVCTHMGCIVAWNNVEGTWDCPCHGARYDPDGKVIVGPAIEDLKEAE